MVLKKPNTSLSIVGGGVERKIVESVDHWSFLEEIEAPMWVDFTLEDQFTDKDIDDVWFRTVHLFHQCPSHHLISSFSLLPGGKMKSPELLLPSPKLPDSVSKSRGKHYRSRKWEEVRHVAALNKQHPVRVLGGKASSGDICSNLTNTIMPMSSSTKPLTSSGNRKSSSNPKASVISECSSTSTITSTSPSIRAKARLVDLKSSLNSNTGTLAENQQMSNSKLPNRMVGYTNRLLSSMRISLAKSSVTRHASRVEVKEGGQLKHRKSSTSKSSVGSSLNAGCNHESVNLAANDGTPESGKDTNSSVGSTNGKVSYGWKTSKHHNPDRGLSSNLKQGVKTSVAGPVYQEAKSKVLHSTRQGKSLSSCNVVDPLKKKVATESKQITASGTIGRGAGVGKENAAAVMDGNQNASKRHAIHEKDSNGLCHVKMKSNGRTQGRNPTNAALRKHFR